MTSEARHTVGSIGWLDLTVPDAEPIRRFYEQVVGWKSSALRMGDYDDFCLNDPATGRPVAGVCNARGENAELPPVWLAFVTVADIAASIERCMALGGSIVAQPRSMGSYGTMAVIRDPVGAALALVQPPADQGTGG
jgi:predicted enzyme related to lactoylglutathione lyase